MISAAKVVFPLFWPVAPIIIILLIRIVSFSTGAYLSKGIHLGYSQNDTDTDSKGNQ
jgi:hypothetical protein